MFVEQGGLHQISITCDKLPSFLAAGQTRKKRKTTNAQFHVDSLSQARPSFTNYKLRTTVEPPVATTSLIDTFINTVQEWFKVLRTPFVLTITDQVFFKFKARSDVPGVGFP